MTSRSGSTDPGRDEHSPAADCETLFSDVRNTNVVFVLAKPGDHKKHPGLPKKTRSSFQNFTGGDRWPEEFPCGGISR